MHRLRVRKLHNLHSHYALEQEDWILPGYRDVSANCYGTAYRYEKAFLF